MKNATWAICALFLLGTSYALSQTPATGDAQSMGTPATAAQPGMSSMGGDPAAEASLQKMEMELSKAAAAHDPTPFSKYLDDNVIALGPGWHYNNKAEVLAGIKSIPCTSSNNTVSGFSYRWLTPDMVLVSYTGNGTMTCGGKTTSGAEHETSLWQKKNGTWVSVFHQGTPDMPAPAGGA